MADYIPTLDTTQTVLWEKPTIADDITLNHIELSQIFSFAGTVDVTKRFVDGIGMSVKNTYILERLKMGLLYNFWKSRNGNYDTFYLPIYNDFFKLVQNAVSGATVIYVSEIPYAEQWLNGNYIWFETKSGDRIVRKITDVSLSGNQTVLTLATGLPYAVSMSDVTFFSRFILCNFSVTSFDIDYTNNKLQEVTLIFHEIMSTDTLNPALYAELYTVLAPGVTAYYTSYYKDITYNTCDFLTSVIQRDKIINSIDIAETNNITISIYPTSFIIQNLFSQPLSKIDIIIDRLDLTSNLSTTLYQGHITGLSANGNMAVVNLQSKDEVLNFSMPKVIYQSTCNNNLYDNYCKIIASNYSENGLITVVSGNDITATAYGNKADGFFINGYIKNGGEYRLITNHVGTTLTLLQPFQEDVTGKILIAYAGCDKSAGTCLGKFNNILNFRGFAYVPDKNPSIWGVK